MNHAFLEKDIEKKTASIQNDKDYNEGSVWC